jgi:hypothetical protein
MIGLFEIARWNEIEHQRKKLLRSLIKIVMESNISSALPRCYSNLKLDIVPLRFAWHSEYSDGVVKKIGSFLNDDWVWFRTPIIATNIPLESFGYQKGNCPISEKIGPQMVNIPCNVPEQFHKDIIARVKESFP